MFPEFTPQFQESINLNNISKKSFLFDFNKGDFILKDGRIVVAKELKAIEIWIEKVLKTEKFKFKIYETESSNEYGVTFMDLIGSKHSIFFVQAEIEREVSEVLLKNNEINYVNNFIFIRDKRNLTINFDVETIYGVINKEVIL